MYGDYVLGLKNAIVPVGRVTAEKARGGWTVKVDDRICGDPVSEKDAQCVVQWLGRNIEWLLNGKNPPRRKEADKDEIEDLINTMYEEKKNGGTKTEEPRRPERNVSVADFM